MLWKRMEDFFCNLCGLDTSIRHLHFSPHFVPFLSITLLRFPSLPAALLLFQAGKGDSTALPHSRTLTQSFGRGNCPVQMAQCSLALRGGGKKNKKKLLNLYMTEVTESNRQPLSPKPASPAYIQPFFLSHTPSQLWLLSGDPTWLGPRMLPALP